MVMATRELCLVSGSMVAHTSWQGEVEHIQTSQR